MKNYFIFLLLLIYSCDGSDVNSVGNENMSLNKSSNLRVVMIDKTTCDLNYDCRQISRNNLFGSWKDTTWWVRNFDDTCWFGIDHIDKDIYIEFLSPDRYIWKEIYKNNLSNFEENGEIFIEDESEGTILTFAVYKPGEENIEVGDTAVGRSFLLSWMNDSTLLLIPPSSDTVHFEIMSIRKFK